MNPGKQIQVHRLTIKHHEKYLWRIEVESNSLPKNVTNRFIIVIDHPGIPSGFDLRPRTKLLNGLYVSDCWVSSIATHRAITKLLLSIGVTDPKA